MLVCFPVTDVRASSAAFLLLSILSLHCVCALQINQSTSSIHVYLVLNFGPSLSIDTMVFWRSVPLLQTTFYRNRFEIGWRVKCNTTSALCSTTACWMKCSVYLIPDISSVHDRFLSLLMYSLMTEMTTSVKLRSCSCWRSCTKYRQIHAVRLHLHWTSAFNRS